MSSAQYDESLSKLKAALEAFRRWQSTGTAQSFLEWANRELLPCECPVCSWPKHPTEDGSARYGTPNAEDERTVSDSPYLHALADAVRLRGAERVILCDRHKEELLEIIERDATGRHPKKREKR